AVLRGDEDLALALGALGEGDGAVDLRDDRVLLWLSGLEELGDAGETARDVLRLGRLARDLREDVARVDLLALHDRDVGAHGEHVLRRLARRGLGRLLLVLRVTDGDARAGLGILGVDDDLPAE